jgi:uncharacterized protein YegL
MMCLDFSQRIPCVILIDCLAPQNESQNNAIHEALQAFQSILTKDSHLTNALDICVMSCGESVSIEQDFISGADFQIPAIRTSTQRNLNTALNMVLTKLSKQRMVYWSLDTRHTKPLLIVISDGRATDRVFEEETRDRVRECISKMEVAYVPMRLGDADIAYLESFYPTLFGDKTVLDASASEFRDVMPSFWRDNDIFTPPIPNCITIGI